MKDCEIWPQRSKGKKAAITSVTELHKSKTPPGGEDGDKIVYQPQFYILDFLNLGLERGVQFSGNFTKILPCLTTD